LKPTGIKRLKLMWATLLSTSAFNFNLRRYNMALTQLWPHLNGALSTVIGRAVGRILSRISPLGLQLSFKEFNLGTEVPPGRR
jgi:hypothetical protein